MKRSVVRLVGRSIKVLHIKNPILNFNDNVEHVLELRVEIEGRGGRRLGIVTIPHPCLDIVIISNLFVVSVLVDATTGKTYNVKINNRFYKVQSYDKGKNLSLIDIDTGEIVDIDLRDIRKKGINLVTDSLMNASLPTKDLTYRVIREGRGSALIQRNKIFFRISKNLLI